MHTRIECFDLTIDPPGGSVPDVFPMNLRLLERSRQVAILPRLSHLEVKESDLQGDKLRIAITYKMKWRLFKSHR